MRPSHKGQGVRSTESQAPFQILNCDDEGIISTGSAFFYNANNKIYLITNWHNVSGKDPFTDEILGSAKRIPTHLEAKICKVIDDVGSFTTVAHRIEIYDSGRSTPLWFEHPEYGRLCDAIAIEMKDLLFIPEELHVPVNKIHNINIPVKPGGTVFIVGFPHGISTHIGWPIWKSGYIASEPHYDVTIGGNVSKVGGLDGGKTIPAFLIDSLTRQGMSGSPIFANYIGNWDMSDPYNKNFHDDPQFWERDDIALGENRSIFIGLYSGRVPSRENEAAFGFCIKRSAIDEICRTLLVGTHPHFT